MSRKTRRRAKADSDVVITTLPSGEREFVVDPKTAAGLTTMPVEVIETKSADEAETKTEMGESIRRGGSHFVGRGSGSHFLERRPTQMGMVSSRSRAARKLRAKQVVIDRILKGKSAVSNDAIFDVAYDLAHEDGMKAAAEEAREILDRVDRYVEERTREGDRIFAERTAKAAQLVEVVEPSIDYDTARQNALRVFAHSKGVAVEPDEAEPVKPVVLDSKELASIVESKLASSALGRKAVWPVATAPDIEVVGMEGPARNRRIVINH